MTNPVTLNPISFLTAPTEDRVYAEKIKKSIRSLMAEDLRNLTPIEANCTLKFWITAGKIQAIQSDGSIAFFDPNVLPEGSRHKADGRINDSLDSGYLRDRENRPDVVLFADKIKNTVAEILIENLLPAPRPSVDR